MSKDIEIFINNCQICDTCEVNNSKETLLSHEVPNKVWYKVGIDLFVFKGIDYLVLIDYFSKFVELKKLNSTKSSDIILILKDIFSRQGIPEVVFSDNASYFVSEEFKKFAKCYNFDHKTSSPRYAQSNGLIERTVQTVKNILKTCCMDGKDP